eukprot:6132599-Prorocentrum_lima.AAC.1
MQRVHGGGRGRMTSAISRQYCTASRGGCAVFAGVRDNEWDDEGGACRTCHAGKCSVVALSLIHI